MTREDTPREREDDLVETDLGGGKAAPGPDELFRALSVAIRRQCLIYLLTESEATTEGLADVIAGWRSTTEGVVGPSERTQIAVELRHVHLPLLANAHLIDYDSATGTVRLGDVPPAVCDIVRHAREYERTVEERP